jgi:hypothetical protein
MVDLCSLRKRFLSLLPLIVWAVAMVGCGGGITASPSSTATPTAAIALSPTTLAFGSVALGSSSTQKVTISNSGSATMTISGITVSGDFTQSNNCGSSLGKGASCNVSVTFAPTAAGSRTGSLSIADSVAGSPQEVALTGTGQSAGALTASPSSVAFGSVVVDSAVSKTVQLSNGSSASITISSASTSGPGFSISGLALPLTLAAGKSGSFTVAFAPTSSGNSTGSVSLVNTGATSPVTIALSGTGTAPVAHSVDLSWSASSSTVIGYNVYRGTQTGGPYTAINPVLQSGTSFADSTVASGKTYYYVVTAVNSNQVESTPSNEAVAVVP